MTNYTVILTDDQVLALEYEAEQQNMQRTQMVPPGGTPPTPITPEQLLNERVAMMLQGSYMQVKNTIAVVESMLDPILTPLTEEKLSSVNIAPSIKNYLRKKHLTVKE